MKKQIVLVAIAVIAGFLIMSEQAIANPDGFSLNWGSELNADQCPNGELVINITHKTVNGLDSGFADWWAFVEYNRSIKVWQVDDNEFCAIAKYVGKFVTIDGPSPQNTDPDGIAEGIKGTFQGGYKRTITGTLKSDPIYRTKGNIGKFDYKCEANYYPSHEDACPYLFIWQDEYFESGWTGTWDWWGWIYRTGKYGTWVNSSDGSEGDITDD